MITADAGPQHPESMLAGAIAARRWEASRGVSVRALGQGSNNTLFLAAGGNERVVVKLSKPHREAGALDEYRKESWCAARARALDVATPEVLEVGVFDGRAFQVQSFVGGRAPSASQAISTWQALGDYARRINSIPVAGWGRTLVADGRFAESWTAHLEYNIAALTPDDELVARGVLTGASSLRLREELEQLRHRDFRFGLCHGDIALWNILIDGSGRPWLLDWGCAASAVVPHHEINEILRTANPGKPQLAGFLRGYGLSAKDMTAMARERRVLAALREIDTLRWAIEKQPERAASQGERARRAAENLD
jgi:Ser/Thr protein kinase RdoA (MazF antagonist)